MIYEMRCKDCGWEGEVTCKAAERHQQKCTQRYGSPQAEGDYPCPGELEVLISSTAETRFGFGFAPGLERADGTPVPGSGGKQRPTTVQRGK